MKIQHRISFNSATELVKKIKSTGVVLAEGPIISTLEVDESDGRWPDIEYIIKGCQVVDLVHTKFTAQELDKSKWLCLNSDWHCGYPMPDDDLGYLELTYNLSKYDDMSGMGYIQKAPFRMKSEPLWKKNHFLQLHWVYDVFFVLPEVWESVFKPLSIDCIPVLLHGSDQKLKTVVQLKAQGELPVPIDLDDYPKKGDKYLPVTKGFFPSISNTDVLDGHYLLSKEYFGSGASASKAVIVSSVFYSAVRSNKLKGVNFTPIMK